MTPSEIAERLVTITEEDGWLYVRCVGMESMSVRLWEYGAEKRRRQAEKRAAELRARIEEALR